LFDFYIKLRSIVFICKLDEEIALRINQILYIY